MKNWFIVLIILLQAAWSEASELEILLGGNAPRDQYLSANFGITFVHMSQYRDWTITNTGLSDLNINKIIIRGVMFDAQTNCPRIMLPKKKCLLRARYNPFTEGFHSGQLDVIFNEGGNIYIDLYGNAHR